MTQTNYVWRKEGRAGSASYENCIDRSILGFTKNTEKNIEIPITVMTTQEQIEKWQKQEKRSGKKNTFLDSSCDKLARLHRRKPGHD